MQYVQNLLANKPMRTNLSGRFFVLEELGSAPSLALRFEFGQTYEEIGIAKRGFKLRLGGGGRFERVTLTSSVDATVRVIVSDTDVDIDFVDGGSTNATIVGPLPLQVSNDRGTPGSLLYVTGVSLADAPATAASANAPVACTSTAAVVVTADPSRRAIRMCSLGPDPVSIGAPGLTWARRTIVLNAGDVWLEDRGANLAWSAICDTGKTASVTWQGVTA